MREARAAVAAGLTLIVIALAAVLAHSPATVAATNGIAAQDWLGTHSGATRICQAGETLPSGVSAIVVALSAFHGPRLSVEERSGGRVVALGRRGSNWSGRTVTIPVSPFRRALGGVTICLAFTTTHETVSPYGLLTPSTAGATDNGAALPGRLSIEYLRPGRRSWWSFAASIASHMGLGRAAGGVWVAYLAIALAVAFAATATAALLRELR